MCAPVAKMNSVRVLLLLATIVATTLARCGECFLHGDLHDEVYVVLLLEFKLKNQQGKLSLKEGILLFKIVT